MKFTLEIACDNDAFEASPALEVQRILRSAARRVAAQGLRTSNTSLFDGYGNKVGQWTYDGAK